MHVEPPGHAPTNLKELAIHYLMIVVGILTALGLEAGAEAWHHQRLARQTMEQLDSELRTNLNEVRLAVESDLQVLNNFSKLHEALMARLRAGKLSRAEASTMLNEGLQRVGFSTPTLRRDAWDTALADQALMHLPREQLHRYSEAYSSQRDMEQALITTTQSGMSVNQLSAVMTDAALGQLDGVEAAKMLQAYVMTMGSNVGNLKELGKLLERTLAHSTSPVPASAASTSRH